MPIRVTVPLPPAVHRQAKAAAALEGLTLRQLVTDALQARLSRPQPQEAR